MEKTKREMILDRIREAFRYIQTRAKELGYNVEKAEEKDDDACTYFNLAIPFRRNRAEGNSLEILIAIVRGAGMLYNVKYNATLDRLEMGVYWIVYKEGE